MSVALDMTRDAQETLTVAEHGTHSFTGLFFLPQHSFQAQVKDHAQSGGFHEAGEK